MSSKKSEAFRFTAVDDKIVSALYDRPRAAGALLALGHGAGTRLDHPFMQELSDALNEVGVATLRYNYPYSEKGGGMDGERVRLATVRAAIDQAAQRARERGRGRVLPLFAGGHSMSGRMTSLAASQAAIEQLRGMIFFAFPLHAGKPSRERAAHLSHIDLPMLFLSGDRDKMAELSLLRQVVKELGDKASLQMIDTADHGFKVLKRRTTATPVMSELAAAARAWIDKVLDTLPRDKL